MPALWCGQAVSTMWVVEVEACKAHSLVKWPVSGAHSTVSTQTCCEHSVPCSAWQSAGRVIEIYQDSFCMGSAVAGDSTGMLSHF